MYARCAVIMVLFGISCTIANEPSWYDICYLNVQTYNGKEMVLNKTFRTNIFNCADHYNMFVLYCHKLREYDMVTIQVHLEQPDRTFVYPWRTCEKETSLEVAHIIFVGFCIALACLIIYLGVWERKWKNKWQRKREEIREIITLEDCNKAIVVQNI